MKYQVADILTITAGSHRHMRVQVEEFYPAHRVDLAHSYRCKVLDGFRSGEELTIVEPFLAKSPRYTATQAVTHKGTTPVRWGYIKDISWDEEQGTWAYLIPIMTDEERKDEIILEYDLRVTTQDDLDSLKPPVEPKARPLTVGDLITILSTYPADMLVAAETQEVMDFVTTDGIELLEPEHSYLRLPGEKEYYAQPVLSITGY